MNFRQSASAELKSTKKGCLISRTNKTQPDAINNPSTALNICQVNSSGNSKPVKVTIKALHICHQFTR